MPIFGVTLFIDQKGYGVTESLWINSEHTDPKQVAPTVEMLVAKRVPLLGINSFLYAYKITLEGGVRTYFTFHYPGDGLTTPTQEKSDFIDSRLLLEFANAGNTKHKNLFMGAIWDSVNIEGGKYVPSDNWTAYLNQYFAEIVAKKWGWLSVNNKRVRAVDTVVQNANGTVNVTTAAGLFPGPFPQQAEVRVAKVEGASQINGPQLVVATDDHTFRTQKRIAIFPYLTGGRVTFSELALVESKDVRATRIVERKAGKLSYRSRGRRAG